MLPKEFEDHPLWSQTDAVLAQLEQIERAAQADEVVAVRRIEFLVTHVQSYRRLGPAFAGYFNEPLLSPVAAELNTVLSQLQTRASSSTQRPYTDYAMNNAENILVHTAAWPRPYAKGAQVQQMTTFYEQLRATQARDLASMEQAVEDMKATAGAVRTEMLGRKDEFDQQLEAYKAHASEIAAEVIAQKVRIDVVVEKGLERVNELSDKNSEAFELWRAKKENDWSEFADQNIKAMNNAATSAANSLQKLRSEEKEYANLISALAGAKLANEFDTEATTARRLGLGLYGAGFLILALAALPLVWLLLFPPAYNASEGPWQTFLIRVSLGVLGASAATVLIRLGSRFVTGSTASKRMALELQTFGPFLANVKDTDTVDGARLELIDRAFGKSYVQHEKDSESDAVPVSAFAHILDLVKAMK